MLSPQRKKININMLIPFLIIALVFGTMLWQKYRNSQEVPVAPQIQPSAGKRTATLFFVAEGVRLAREARELEPCEDTVACINSVLEELLNGPVGEFDEPLPEGTVVKSVRVENDLAIVDFNEAFSKALLSGSSAEMLAVYSVVDTVAVNFSQISRVKLTIEGDPSSLLKHLDLSEPLLPDYTLEQSPSPSPSPPSDPNAAVPQPAKPLKGKP